MELVELLDVIYYCSLTDESKSVFMLRLIDHMMIEGAHNPFENSEDDTLNRIFQGTRPFPGKKAKHIYMHRDAARLSSFIRNMGDGVVYNIESEIQKHDESYEQDESCYRLSELVFSKLNSVFEKSSKTNRKTAPFTEDDEEIYQKAQAFCIEHEDELGLLLLCQIATYLNPLHRCFRRIYTDFCKCSIAVRKKILELYKLRMSFAK